MTLLYLPEADRKDFNDLVWASTCGDIETVIEITNRKPKLASHKDAETGIVPALHSIIHGHHDCTQHLLLLTGHPDDFLDPEGNSLFMWAVSVDDIPMAKELLALGANIHKTNKYGRDAMMEAARRNRGAMIDFLADAGANMNAQDNKGRTPLMIAAKRFSHDAIKRLYMLGASTTIKDSDNETVHDKAYSRCYRITADGSIVREAPEPVRPENELREATPTPS